MANQTIKADLNCHAPASSRGVFNPVRDVQYVALTNETLQNCSVDKNAI